MDKKQQEYFDVMMSKPSGEDNQYSSGGNGGGCLTNIIALCIAIFILAIIGSLFD